MFFEYLVKKIKCEDILNQYVSENMLSLVVNNFTLVYTDILCFIGSNNKKEKNWINNGIVNVTSALSK